MRAPSLRGQEVHLPRIVLQIDTGRRGHAFAFLDQVMDEMSEIRDVGLRGEVLVVRQAGQGGDAVHGGIEDELRPLGRAEVGQRLGLKARLREQCGDRLHALEGGVPIRAKPRRCVEDVLHVRVGVLRSAHERHRGHERPVAVTADHVLRAQAVLDGHDRRAREAALERGRGHLESGCLRRDDAQVEVG